LVTSKNKSIVIFFKLIFLSILISLLRIQKFIR
jgi:hypothetical protein